MNLDHFDPLVGHGPEADARRHKAFVELALLAWRLAHAGELGRDPQLEQLLNFVAATFEVDAFRERLIRLDDFFSSYALLFMVLSTCGRIEDEWEQRRLQRVLQRSTIQIAERPAHRDLELRHVFDTLGLGHSLPTYDMLARKTILMEPIHLVRATDSDAYSITHDLLYLSDWGHSPIRGLSHAALRRTHRVVNDMLGMYVYSRNWDLTGELLLVSHFLGDRQSDFYRIGWRALHDAQRVDGAVPGPGYEDAIADLKQDADRRDYEFNECYHPTLVAALVGGLCPDPQPRASA